MVVAASMASSDALRDFKWLKTMSVSATMVFTSRLRDCREMRPLTSVTGAASVEAALKMDCIADVLDRAGRAVNAAVCRENASNKAMVKEFLENCIKKSVVLPIKLLSPVDENGLFLRWIFVGV